MKWLLIVLIGLTYYVLGQISFLTVLPISPAGPALAWLPTGFAVAAIYLYGFGIWPGIALGSLLNADLNVVAIPVVAGFVIANTLDPIIAVWLTRRGLGREVDFYRPLDVIVFILVVSFVSSPFSASVGAASLFMSHAIPPNIFNFALTWLTWWISDLLSVLVLTPLLMSWRQAAPLLQNKRNLGAKIFGGILGVAVLYTIFSMPLGRDTIHFVYWVFPVILWQAIRHGLRVTAASIFLLALVTVWATSQGIGPFIGPSMELSFLYVHSFLAVSSITALLVVAVVSERDRAIHNRDEFFLIASHELYTPLTVLSMLSKFLDKLVSKEGLDSMTRAQRMDLIRMNSKETQRLSKLVEDLLEGSRIAAGRLVLEPVDTDLSEIVREVIHEHSDQASQSNVSVHLNAGTEILGKWDERRLYFVVRTLMANALKFGEGNPISISVERKGSLATIIVEDKGIGIAEGSQQRIFERFSRLKSVASYGGLGQGLFISMAIMRAHRGNIRVESRPGKGSTFIVELPSS